MKKINIIIFICIGIILFNFILWGIATQPLIARWYAVQYDLTNFLTNIAGNVFVSYAIYKLILREWFIDFIKIIMGLIERVKKSKGESPITAKVTKAL